MIYLNPLFALNNFMDVWRRNFSRVQIKDKAATIIGLKKLYDGILTNFHEYKFRFRFASYFGKCLLSLEKNMKKKTSWNFKKKW